MTTWSETFRAALASGGWAAGLSSLALTVTGQLELGDPIVPNNAPSQWVLGEQAAYEPRVTFRHTVVGVVIHAAMSVFWATLHERWIAAARPKSTAPRVPAHAPTPATILARAGLTAALACFVDYNLTPRRLRPGFEKHLSRQALAVVYAAFAVGLAMPQLQRERGIRPADRSR